ncbi:hypothetical protein [Nocardia farcinica]|nr:hypothetical protein [Nocardia farcinica]
MASVEEHALVTTDPSELADTADAEESGLDITEPAPFTPIVTDDNADVDTGLADEDGDGDVYVDVQAA